MSSPHRLLAWLRRQLDDRSERGSTSIEAAIVIPTVMIFILLMVAAGRVALAQSQVVTAAEAGARAASIERSSGQARSSAAQVAAATLRSGGVSCSPDVSTSTGGFAVPVGQPASVTTTVTCTVALGDLAVPGLPGSRTFTSTATSPLDTYRGRR